MTSNNSHRNSSDDQSDKPETTHEHEHEVARIAAQCAHEAAFSHRRGLLPSDSHTLVFYDNNPYSDPNEDRHEEHEQLKRAMERCGIRCLAEASYPVGGESDGYTVALVFHDPTRSGEEIIRQEWTRIISR